MLNLALSTEATVGIGLAVFAIVAVAIVLHLRRLERTPTGRSTGLVDLVSPRPLPPLVPARAYEVPRYRMLGAARGVWLLCAAGAFAKAVFHAWGACFGEAPFEESMAPVLLALLAATAFGAVADLSRMALDLEEYARTCAERARDQLVRDRR